MLLLVDTGFVFALADRSDAWHVRARRYVESTSATLLAPVTILPEVAYLLRNRIGAKAERAFVAALGAGELAVEDLTARDWKRTAELLGVYDTIGMVDASVVAVAERLRLVALATTDRRDFAIVRPAHVERFTLVP